MAHPSTSVNLHRLASGASVFLTAASELAELRGSQLSLGLAALLRNLQHVPQHSLLWGAPITQLRTFASPSRPYSPLASGTRAHQLQGPQLPTQQSLLTFLRRFSDESSASKAAAVRRLAAAKARRERDAAAAIARASPANKLTVQETALVTPAESKASDLQLSTVLQRPALIVTRPIEWGQVILGYEQANKYTVYDESGNIVALMAEDYTGLGNEVGRQLLRSRRSFTSTVFSADGSQVLFKVKRPAYLINSTMHVEDGAGNEIGEIRQRWHPIKRNYDLYLGKRQFAAISGNFLAWEFELKDANGGTLALIDRNFSGFGKEIFTDAGKYIIHFGMDPQHAADVATQTVHARVAASQPQAAVGATPATSSALQPLQQQQPLPRVTPLALARTDAAVIPTVTGSQLVVARPLELSERMLTLACAITVDYDFFSQHSRMGSGLFSPPIIMPVPLPGGGGGGVTPDAAGGDAASPGTGVDGGGTAGAGAAGAVHGTSDGLGGASGAAPGGGGFGDFSGDGGAAGGDAGWSQGDSGGMFGSSPPGGDDGGFKWDLPQSSGSGDSGDNEGVMEGAKEVLGKIWEMFDGDD